MDRVVQTVVPLNNPQLKRKRVCAYARVSREKDAMMHSLAAQISYYQKYIQSRPLWEFCGVYADEPISGTKEKRKQFLLMVDECKKGNIDLIITKSISRFARNTVVLLETVRKLKNMGVEVFFEEQNISSFTTEGELMLSILAGYAQEESFSMSQNMLWRIKKNFEEGKPWSGNISGYRLKNGRYEIVPDEAEIIRKIAQYYCEGYGYLKISMMLNEEGYRTRHKGLWSDSTISDILKNYNYTGNLLLQKTYRTDHLTKKTKRNKGEYPQYIAMNTHDAIIPLETFNKVQEERQRRAKQHNGDATQNKTHLFTMMIQCRNCGCHYRRYKTKYRISWVCRTYMQLRGECAHSQSIPEDTLIALSCEVMGVSELNETLIREKIEKIIPIEDFVLLFKMRDGTETRKEWQYPSRSAGWTAEKREKQSNVIKGVRKNAASNDNTGDKNLHVDGDKRCR